MSDDECDLEELTAFLEEDSDKEGDSCEHVSIASHSDSKSNTDTEKQPGTGTGTVEQNVDLTEVELQALLDDSDLEEPELNDPKEESIDPQVGQQKTEKQKDPSVSEQNDLAAELARMKEKMKLLEQQLEQKANDAPGHTHLSSKSEVKTRQLKDLDEDIFSSETTEERIGNLLKGSIDEADAKENNLKKEKVGVETTDDVVASKKFFPGDSDDSDWEGMDGEKSTLSKEGKEIKKILKTGQKERQAHIPKYNGSEITKPKESKTWKASVDPSTSSLSSSSNSRPAVDTSSSSRSADNMATNSKDKVKDELYNGIRVINPLISFNLLKTRMEGRRLIKLSHLHRKVGTMALEGDWVTTGVVVSKSETRLSGNGKNFVIWKLSDLEDCDKVVSFFLFGEVYKRLWKTELGKVIAILNPSIMPASDKQQNSSDVSFTVDNFQKVMMLGSSRDMGKCKAKTKSGQNCSNFINKNQGEFCTYHVQYGYKKTCAQRVELQASYTGPQPKAYEKKFRQKNEGTYFYGGQTFTTGNVKSQKKKDKVSIQTLKQHTSKAGKATTMTFLHPVQPQDQAKLNALSEKQKAIHDLISTPSAGAMNFVKHLEKKEGNEAMVKAKNQDKPIVSITPKELLQQTQKEHRERMRRQKNQASDTITQPRQVNPLECVPQLGKGIGGKGDIFFEDTTPLHRPLTVRRDNVTAAKNKALAKIKASGGIERQDPNAMKKKKSPETMEVKRKRFAMELAAEDSTENKNPTEPPRKRSRLLGDLDPDSEEFKRLMSAKSSHTAAISEIELEQQEKYFNELEKKEKYEDKMNSTMEVKCMVVVCKQCKYMAQSAAERCKEGGHTLVRKEAMKRFFKCLACGKRTIAFGMLPTKSCSGCGDFKFEKTSMWKEKKGPMLDSEKLLLRGVEEKFLS